MRGRSAKMMATAATLFALGAMVPASAAAQGATAAPAAERTIRVAGIGEVQVTPDVAQVSLSVETTGATAQAASQANARAMQKVLSALMGAGIPKDSIETSNYQLFPQYANNERGEEPTITGYRAMNQVTVTTGRTDQVGNLIDVALAAGANRLQGISFQIRNPEPAQAQALTEAVRRARATAETMARALGVTLGPVLDASTAAQPPMPVPIMYSRAKMEMAAAPPAPPTPIQPEDQTVQATVSLVYSINGR